MPTADPSRPVKKSIRHRSTHRDSGKSSKDPSIGPSSILGTDSIRHDIAEIEAHSDKSDDGKTPVNRQIGGRLSGFTSNLVLSGHGQRNILEKLGNGYSLQRVTDRNPALKQPTLDVRDSEEFNSRTDPIEDRGSALRQNPSSFQLEDNKNKDSFKSSYKARNVTNWWQESREPVKEDDEESEDFLDLNKSMNHKPSHRAKTVMQTQPRPEDCQKKYIIMKLIGVGSYSTVTKVNRKSDFMSFVIKSMSLEEIAKKMHSFFPTLSHEDQIQVAKDLCENEIHVSELIEGHPNISIIEESYFDKAEQKYHLYSLYAENGTLLSQEHESYIQKLNDGSSKLTTDQVKDLFRQIARALKHST